MFVSFWVLCVALKHSVNRVVVAFLLGGNLLNLGLKMSNDVYYLFMFFLGMFAAYAVIKGLDL